MDESHNQLAEHSERQEADDVIISEVEDRVGAGLEALNAGGDSNDVMEAFAAAKPGSDETAEDAVVEDTGDSVEDVESGTDADPQAEEAADDDAVIEDELDYDSDSPTLPDSYRRSLYAAGWKDEQIDQNLAHMGADFLRIAAQQHEARTRQLAAFAEAGRADQPTPEADVEEPTDVAVPAGGLSPINTAALKEEFGEDAVIDAIVDPVNKVINAINAIIPQLQAGQTAVQQAENERLEMLVNEFFGADQMKGYTGLYGEPGKRTPEQEQAVGEVLRKADAIGYGAKAQNQPMTIEEMLFAAHDIVSAPYAREQIRNEVRGEAKRRTKGVSLRPGGRRKAAPTTGKPRTEQELEDKVGARMAEVFGVMPA